MSRIVSQGPCPNPKHIGGQQSDAYTIYEDGSSYCFTCGYYKRANKYKQIMKTHREEPTEVPPMPDDVIELVHISRMLPCSSWLDKYGITCSEMEDHGFLWSEQKKYLIFPVYDETGNVLMWQARYFGDNPRHPKYITRGHVLDTLHILENKQTDVIVLVEDLISAIKVGRQHTAMPLWGSKLHSEVTKRLSFTTAYLWLDYDKRDYAVSRAPQDLYIEVLPIITKLDPKYYSDEEIRQILNDRRTNNYGTLM